MLANNQCHYGALTVSGLDATNFLQGQLSCDLKDLRYRKYITGAYCNIKGRVIAIIQVHKTTDDNIIQLQMPKDVIPKVQAELKKYGMFSQITIEQDQDFNKIINIIDLINNNTPEIFASTSELFLPHNINLPKLGIINFNKGCYRGQEIIARMEYKGKIKKHLAKITLPAKNASKKPGEKIYKNDEHIGTIVISHINDTNTIVLAEVLDGYK